MDMMSRPTPNQSNGKYDFLGQLPDIKIAKNSRAILDIPNWKIISSDDTTYPIDFDIHCDIVDKNGEIIYGQCPEVGVFIDQDKTLWVEPSSGWVGDVLISLRATNYNGEIDSDSFFVHVVELDQNQCNSRS